MAENLLHYGIKGMRWGRRGSSNKAPVTSSFNSGGGEKPMTGSPGAFITNKHIKEKRKAIAANRRLISTKDLDFTIARLEKEKKLKQLIDDDVTPGKRVALAITSEVGTNVIKKAATGAGTFAVKKAIGKKFGDEVAQEIIPKKKK